MEVPLWLELRWRFIFGHEFCIIVARIAAAAAAAATASFVYLDVLGYYILMMPVREEVGKLCAAVKIWAAIVSGFCHSGSGYRCMNRLCLNEVDN